MPRHSRASKSATKQFALRYLPASLALALGAFALSQTKAQTAFDPAQLMKERLQTTPSAMAQLSADGRSKVSAVKFALRMRTSPAQLDLDRSRGGVPDNMVLQDQVLHNCTPNDGSLTLSASGTTNNSESFSVTDTIGGSTTVEVSFESPLSPVSGRVAQTFEYSTATTKTRSSSRERNWGSSNMAVVQTGRRVRVQYQVEYREFRDVPWQAELTLGGNVELSMARPFKVCMYEHAGYGGAYKCIEPTERAEWPWLAGIAYDNSRKTLASPIGISDNNISSLKFEGEGRTTFWSRGNFGGWTWRRDAPSTVWDLSQGYGSGANPNDRFQAALFEPVITVLNKDLAALLPASARTFRISGTYSGAGGVQGVWMQQDEGPANCPPTLQSQPGVSGAGSGNRGAVGIRVETFDPKIARPIKARSPG